MGINLAAFLGAPLAEFRTAMEQCVNDANAVDATADPALPPFAPLLPLEAQANARTVLADDL